MNRDLPKLLRAIAGGSNAKKTKHDVILLAAADELERARPEGIVAGLEMASKFLSVTRNREQVESMIRAAIASATEAR